MTDLQKRHRIKTLWKKARKVLLVTRLKMAIGSFSKAKNDDDLEDFDNQEDQKETWKWWIIR